MGSVSAWVAVALSAISFANSVICWRRGWSPKYIVIYVIIGIYAAMMAIALFRPPTH